MAAILAGIRVLVVEDDEDNRCIIGESLRFEGGTVEAVATAREAAQMFDRFDIIVTDFAMPDCDGVWLLEEVARRVRPIPVILLSGFAETQRQAIAHAPFARKLLKPIDPDDLCAEIIKTLNRH